MKPDSSTLDVFVYGTLKPGYANHATCCEGKIISSTPAYTRGNLYELPMGYPAMTPGNNRVFGVLLRFNDDKILTSLDCLEDYQEHRSQALNQYYRSWVTVYDFNDQAIAQAWAYYMTSTRVQSYQGIELVSGCWN